MGFNLGFKGLSDTFQYPSLYGQGSTEICSILVPPVLGFFCKNNRN